MKSIIATDHAPKAIGLYSQAIVHNGLVFCSGQIPLDPATGQMVEGDIVVQTERVFASLKALLEASGSSIEKVLKTTVYLKDISDFPKMNEVYARFFSSNFPARSTIEAGRLPRDAKVEIDAIAFI